MTNFGKRQRLPVILQTEAAECGLACVAMISTYWGHSIDISGMRRLFSVSLKGVDLKSLVQIAAALCLHARPVKINMEYLQQVRCPCILHWQLKHFVVLKRVGKNYFVIHDPAIGERRLSFDDVSDSFTGVAVELMPAAGFKEKEDRRPISLNSLMGTVHGLKRGLLHIVALGIALQIVTLATPFFLQWIIDDALVAGDASLITTLAIGFILVAILQGLIAATRYWLASVLATELNFQWYGNTFSHLMRLPLLYFQKRHLVDIVSRFNSIQTIQQALTVQFAEGILDGLLVLTTFVAMMVYNLKLALISFAAVTLYIVIRLVFYSSLREATSEQIVQQAKQQTHLLESVRGVQSIRLFQKEEERRIVWTNTLAEQFGASLRMSKVTMFYRAASTILYGVDRVIIIWIAALSVLRSEISIGMLFAFLSYKDQFSQRAGAFTDRLVDLRILRIHGSRLADIMHADAETRLNALGTANTGIEPVIRLVNVGFKYAECEDYVLRNVSLTIQPGQCVAFAGPSGCGKTTLLKIILGLLEPSEGKVLVDGVPASEFGTQNLRAMCGAVMQDDQLFTGSIVENISFFDSSPDMDLARSCARLAAIDGDISRMPMKYQTLIGDSGAGLSGGQKQRVLLARALYKKPTILVLDEATSHLDVDNERKINAAIKALTLTRIMVAHRPETIAMADRIINLDQGQTEIHEAAGAARVRSL